MENTKIKQQITSKYPLKLKKILSKISNIYTFHKYYFLLLIFPIYSLNAQNQISIENIYEDNTFQVNTVRGINSMKDGLHYTSLTPNRLAIIKYEYETGNAVDTLFNAENYNEDLINFINSYRFNSDETKIIFSVQYEPIYRYSYKAEFFIYDISNSVLNRLSENGKQKLAYFSPSGNKVSFVRDNNIYIKKLGEHEEHKEYKITEDGKRNNIINGSPDWVYEEEFSFHKAYEWSPDGKRIAFYKTDESHVKTFNISIYGNLYPEQYTYKYPKAGEKNSKVSIHIYDIESGNTLEANLGNMNDKYIPRIKWTLDSEILSVIKLNRLQNKYELYLVDANTGNSDMILKIEDDKYIEIDNNLTFIDNNKAFLMTHEQSGYKHIYMYDINGRKIKQLTEGEWEVTELYGYCDNNKLVYFQAAKSSIFNRDVYTVSTNNNKLNKLSKNEGTNDFVFSNGFKYYINNYSNYKTPLYVTLHSKNGKKIRELETNQELVNTIKNDYQFVEKEFFNFQTTEGIELNGWMLKPNDFDETKEYPVLMYVYGGPGHQTVLNSWDRQMPWWQMLVQKGYIVVSVDNRGTGARGKDFRQLTYGQLGKYETIDQIETAKYLGNKNYIDKDRIGIFGWSYGGYIAALCMTIGADYFNVGISVAPVTNWRHYDTIYTERYNGLPQDNPNGYDDNSPVNHVDKLRGRLLLVHGTADDNVHVENTYDFINELISANKNFDLLIYPNRNHSIHGGNTRLHLFSNMTDFVMNNL